MPSNPKMLALLDEVVALTQEGKAAWEQVAEDTFVLGLGAGFIVVDSLDGDGLAPYRFFVSDARPPDGNFLEGLIQTRGIDEDDSDGLESALNILYAMARRVALNIDPVLDRLLNEVKTQRSTGS